MVVKRDGKWKRVSKKSKASWRKNVDITDVEEHLEDQRLEERLGTPFASKPDSELFILDTDPSNPKVEEPTDDLKLSAKQRKRAKLINSFPKCFNALLPSSKVQDPVSKRNIVKPVVLHKLNEERKQKKGVYAQKLEMLKVNLKRDKREKVAKKKARSNFNLNIWGNDVTEAKVIPAGLMTEWATEEVQQANIPCSKRMLRPKKENRSKIRAIQLPHPGTSYNPTFEDHQDLLRQVADKEKELMEKRRRINRLTTSMYKMVQESDRDNSWLAEMSSDLSGMLKMNDIVSKEVCKTTRNRRKSKKTEEDTEVNNESSEESDSEYKAVNPPVKNKKKDPKKRRTLKQLKLEAAEKNLAKIEKKKVADIQRLHHLTAAINEADKYLTVLRGIRAERRTKQEEYGQLKLNAHKYKEPDLVFSREHELSGNLRNIVAQGCLLKDRYQSFQQRSILAPTKKFGRKKTKVKKFWLPGCKITEEEIKKHLKD